MALDAWTYVPQGSGPPDTYGSTDYSEILNSGNITSTPGNSSITRTFFISHSVIPSFLDDLLGFAVVDNDGFVSRPSLPDPHVLYSNYFCLEANVEGLGVGSSVQYSNKTAKSLVAKVTAVYKSIDYSIVPDDWFAEDELYRFVSRTQTFSSEYFTVNSTGMRFVSNVGNDGVHKPLSISPSKLSGVSELTYIWRMVPNNPKTSPFRAPNQTAITTCTGKVNSETFDVGFLNAPAGTVLCLGVEPKSIAPRVTTGAVRNNVYFEITCKFLYRNNGLVNRTTGSDTINEYAGHQFTWDQANLRWDLITTNGRLSGNRLYETADLNDIFTIG